MSLCTPQTSAIELEMRKKLNEQVTSVNREVQRVGAPLVTQMTDYLYVGGYPTEKTLEYLAANHIYHIVNVAAMQFPTRKDLQSSTTFTVHEFGAFDQPDYFILVIHYDEFRELINRIRMRNERVFVHCFAGVNRSVTLCVAYVMQQHRLSVFECVEMLRRSGRPLVLENESFRNQLVEWDVKLHAHQCKDEYDDCYA
jgi:predicted protein tyrosine phosphatase